MNNMRKQVLVLVGPSGVGKSSLAKEVMLHTDSFEFSISATTRAPRDGEEHGTHYHFLSTEDFQERIDNGEFLEWEEFYGGNRYGTLISVVDDIIKKGKKVIFDIEVWGAVNIKKHFGDLAHVVFVKPESTSALVERLRARGTETEEQIKMRVDRFETELAYEDKFDDIIINTTGEFDASKKAMMSILETHFL